MGGMMKLVNGHGKYVCVRVHVFTNEVKQAC